MVIGEELDVEDVLTTMRQDIVALLDANPHCPVAQLLGQAYQDALGQAIEAQIIS